MLPKVFPSPEDENDTPPRFLLDHCDLRTANIIVNPETLKITGIIDWEMAAFVPEWYGKDTPMSINMEEPPIPDNDDSDSEGYQAISTLHRDQWDSKLLRKRFDEKMEELGWAGWRRDSPTDAIKTKFIEGVASLNTSWEHSRLELETIKMFLGDTEGISNLDSSTSDEHSEIERVDD